jgi:site-specific recombinase XerC
VPLTGSLVATDDPWEPYRLHDRGGTVVAAVSAHLRDLQACGRATTTQRSYAMDLLRWFRFLWAIEVPWSQATRGEARDFCLWIQLVDKPARPHWRHPDEPPGAPQASGATGPQNTVTGKRRPGSKYAPATVAHCETVLRGFYDFHLEVGTGPMVNPFPVSRARRGGRPNAHHNPMEPFDGVGTGRYRPKLARRLPRQIPDEKFNELFAGLSSNRDRALVAFWVSSGARASELLGVLGADVDPGGQLITVIRKGTKTIQSLPASPDAFVWLRLYQAQMQHLVPAGRDDPVWWTLRRPFRPVSYHAARAMFVRANATLGSNWTIHDLRHTAAYRMARDPQVPLTDVQWVLGHAQLSTTQLYLTPLTDDVIDSVLTHYARRAQEKNNPRPTDPATLRYRPESLDVLFGRSPS